MKTETIDTVLRVLDLQQLSGTNSAYFKELVRARLPPEHLAVEVDCSKIAFIDSKGLGALVALYKDLKSREGIVRLLNLQPAVRQFLELVQLQKIFEMVP